MATGAEGQQTVRVFSEADVLRVMRHLVSTGFGLPRNADELEGVLASMREEGWAPEMTEEVIARSKVERMLREAVRCGKAGHGVPEPGQGASDFFDRLRRVCSGS